MRLTPILLIPSLFFIFIRAQHFTPQLCKRFYHTVTGVVDCPSYNFILANSNLSSISVFCRMVAKHYYNLEIGSDSQKQEVWKNKVAQMTINNIDTDSPVARLIKRQITQIYRANCHMYLVPALIGSFRVAHLVRPDSTGVDLI